MKRFFIAGPWTKVIGEYRSKVGKWNTPEVLRRKAWPQACLSDAQGGGQPASWTQYGQATRSGAIQVRRASGENSRSRDQ
jgi:hypothetical protein